MSEQSNSVEISVEINGVKYIPESEAKVEKTIISGEESVYDAEIPGVPSALVDELAQELKDTGRPITPDEIRSLYDELSGG